MHALVVRAGLKQVELLRLVVPGRAHALERARAVGDGVGVNADRRLGDRDERAVDEGEWERRRSGWDGAAFSGRRNLSHRRSWG